jgi:hypothetical protein
MNVENTIKASILAYPRLYKDINYEYSRQKVLDHLFIVNGNGYEWENGELVIGDPDINIETTSTIPDNYFDTPIFSEEKDAPSWLIEWNKAEKKKFKPIEICSKKALTFYPICEYAKIMNLPDDIKKDWLQAAEETVELAEDYWRNPYKHALDIYIKEWIEQRKYDDIAKYIQSQLNYYEKAKKRIKDLKA